MGILSWSWFGLVPPGDPGPAPQSMIVNNLHNLGCRKAILECLDSYEFEFGHAVVTRAVKGARVLLSKTRADSPERARTSPFAVAKATVCIVVL